MEQLITETPEVASYVRRTGSEMGMFATAQNTGDILVRLKPRDTRERSAEQVIETLQTDRVQTVYLLDEMVRQMPEGVFLKTLRQRGSNIEVVGYAQSNARVSTLMRNIAASPYLENPDLVEIKATSVNNKRIAEFNMNLSLKRQQADEASKSGGAAAAAKKS